VDIAAWLREVGLERYEQAFRENDIDASLLPDLTEADLERLGISSLGHRKKLLKAIAALGGAPERRIGGHQSVRGPYTGASPGHRSRGESPAQSPPAHLRSAQTAAVMSDRREPGRRECDRSTSGGSLIRRSWTPVLSVTSVAKPSQAPRARRSASRGDGARCEKS
jgi:SAM domain (Sterile alpha motif)